MIPNWVKYIAKDKNGTWWGYELKPIRILNCWVPAGGDMRMVEIDMPEDDADWKSSVKRIRK